jgi:hypothetical protein
MEIQQTAPAGYTSARTGGNLVFQSPATWAKEEANGIMVVGTYDGMTEDINELSGKADFVFTATQAGVRLLKDGKSEEFEAGTTVIINNNGSLAYQLKNVAIGTGVAIQYDGKQKAKKGPLKGKELHSFTVLTKAA